MLCARVVVVKSIRDAAGDNKKAPFPCLTGASNTSNSFEIDHRTLHRGIYYPKTMLQSGHTNRGRSGESREILKREY